MLAASGVSRLGVGKIPFLASFDGAGNPNTSKPKGNASVSVVGVRSESSLVSSLLDEDGGEGEGVASELSAAVVLPLEDVVGADFPLR